MNKLYTTLLILMCITINGIAQKQVNVGAGYFGHFVTHTGIVLEYEMEFVQSEKVSLPVRIDLGYYKQPRYHSALFLDASYGHRRYFKSGLFLEESVGFGIMSPWINSDAVYEVGEGGTVTEGNRSLPVDLMPSITLGTGYRVTGKSGSINTIWLRPKLFWQFPYKTSSVYHAAIQVGISRTIGK